MHLYYSIRPKVILFIFFIIYSPYLYESALCELHNGSVADDHHNNSPPREIKLPVGQGDSSASRLRNISLVMGCTEFQNAFTNTTILSDPSTPFRVFTITKGNGYAYVALHFTKLFLPQGSSMLIRGVETYNRPDSLLNLTDNFPSGQMFEDVHSPPVLAKELRVELYRRESSYSSYDASDSSSNCYGFVIDSYKYVLLDEHKKITPTNEAICAADNSKEAICYYEDGVDSTAYLGARTVARLQIQKGGGETAACTGWLLGSDGHLITNNHCVADENEALRTTAEFMADAKQCNNDCKTWGACPGSVEAISAHLVYTSVEFDYSILRLETNVNLPSKYGYLRLKSTNATVGQQVYIPQHPLYYGKRIAMVDDFGSKLTILDTMATGCETTGYSYNGDTQGGSSGSPVIDSQDHGVVALHHCGQFCANTGIPSVEIIQDLNKHGIFIPDFVDGVAESNILHFPSFKPPMVATPVDLTPKAQYSGAIRISNIGHQQFVSIDTIHLTLGADAEVEIDILSAEISDEGVYTDVNSDCQAAYIDAILFLYAKNTPKPLAVVDDCYTDIGHQDGSVSSRDPYLRTFLRAGEYNIVIGAMLTTSEMAYAGQRVAFRDHPEIYNCVDQSNIGFYKLAISATEDIEAKFPPTVESRATCASTESLICSLY